MNIPNGAGTGSQNGAYGTADETFITQVELLNKAGQPERVFNASDHLIIRSHYVAPKRIETPLFVIRIRRADGVTCCSLTSWGEDSLVQRDIHGQGTFEALIGPLQLVPNIYPVEVHIVDGKQSLVYASSTRETFHIKGHISGSEHSGVFKPNVEWLHQEVTE